MLACEQVDHKKSVSRVCLPVLGAIDAGLDMMVGTAATCPAVVGGKM